MFRDLAKNAVLALPPLARLNTRRRLHRGYDPMKNDPAYPRSVFELHRRALERERPIGGRVLEIGPGGNVAVAALFVAAGADAAVCIDPDPWLAGDPGALYRTLGVDGVMSRVSYQRAAIERIPYPDESFEIVVSHAAFEHFADPLAASQSIARVLKPGGVTTHQVDLRDHRDFSRPLDFLRYGDRFWSAMTSRRMLSTNRWRASDLRAAFESSGLDVRHFEVTERAEVTAQTAASFAPRFRQKSLDDLSIVGLFLTAVKPHYET